MKINPFGTIRPNDGVKKKGGSASASGTNFASFLEPASSEDQAISASSAASMASSVSSLLSLQEVNDEDVRRQKDLRHAASTLDSLEQLRSSLLAGIIPAGVLRELQHRLDTQRQRSSDPELLSLIDDIELRAAVELAKLEMAEERQRMMAQEGNA